MDKSPDNKTIASVSSERLEEMMDHPQNDAPGATKPDEPADDPTALYDLGVTNASPPQ